MSVHVQQLGEGTSWAEVSNQRGSKTRLARSTNPNNTRDADTDQEEDKVSLGEMSWVKANDNANDGATVVVKDKGSTIVPSSADLKNLMPSQNCSMDHDCGPYGWCRRSAWRKG